MRHYDVLPRGPKKTCLNAQKERRTSRYTQTLPFFVPVGTASTLYTTRRVVAAAATAEHIYIQQQPHSRTHKYNNSKQQRQYDDKR